MESGRDNPSRGRFASPREALARQLADLGVLVTETHSWSDEVLSRDVLVPVQKQLFDNGVVVTDSELLGAFDSLYDEEIAAAMSSEQTGDGDESEDEGEGGAGVREPRNPHPGEGSDSVFADDEAPIF